MVFTCEDESFSGEILICTATEDKANKQRLAAGSTSTAMPGMTTDVMKKFPADHYATWPPPLFTIGITIVEFCFFVYYATISEHNVYSEDEPVPMDSAFIYRPDKRGQIWRFLLYMVLHTGWIHLLFNMVVQILVGLPLEMVHGSLRIGAIYLSGVLAGSLATSIFDPEVYLVGSSGGIYALLAAHLANVALNFNSMEHGMARCCGILVIACTDMGFAVYHRYFSEVAAASPVSYVAHGAGAIAGFIVGLVVLRCFKTKVHQVFLRYLAFGVYCAWVLFVFVYYLLSV